MASATVTTMTCDVCVGPNPPHAALQKCNDCGKDLCAVHAMYTSGGSLNSVYHCQPCLGVRVPAVQALQDVADAQAALSAASGSAAVAAAASNLGQAMTALLDIAGPGVTVPA